jgi:hypothetical protein
MRKSQSRLQKHPTNDPWNAHCERLQARRARSEGGVMVWHFGTGRFASALQVSVTQKLSFS